MYSIVIAEDEFLVKKILSEKIDWREMGFTVTGCFEDGESVIEFIKENKVDVILSDISMPYATGIDIAKFVYENKMSLPIVFISGYKEFEFAKSAVEYGIKQYILKPVKIEEIHAIFKELKDELDKRREEDYKKEELEHRYAELINQTRKQVLTNLLYIGSTDLANRSTLSELGLQGEYFLISYIRILNYHTYLKTWKYGQESLNQLFENIIERALDKNLNCVSISYKDDGSVILLSTNEKIAPEKISAMIQSEMIPLKLDISIKFSDFFKDVKKINKHFNEFMRLADKQSNPFSYSLESEKLLMSFLNIGDISNALKVLDSIFSDLQSQLDACSKKEDVINFFCREMLEGIGKYLDSLNTTINDICKNKLPGCDDFYRFGSLDEIKKLFGELLYEIIEYNERNYKDTNENVTEFLLQYINDNIEKDISLSMLSSLVFMHPVYLSRYFKKSTGENFKNYLIKIRMEKAKTLLKDIKLKIKDISMCVGYVNIKHFYKTFKNYTGMTPSEYRSKLADKYFERGGKE